MTSSLVGSEMCIRDSLRRLRLLSDQLTAIGLVERECMTNPTTSPATVSYTHLTLPTICSV
eukprot:1775956-Prorocentrum_lima.AAC.1